MSRRTALAVGGLAATAALPAPPPAGAAADDPWAEVPRILARVRPPRFPHRSFDIRDFGAVPGGVVPCTEAFRRAVTAAHEAGGGHVVVPDGRYLTGAIQLRSGVDLHVTENAVIAFSPDPADHLPAVLTRWEGTECWNYSPFVYAHGCVNVAVTGTGILDGQARLGPWESWYRDGTLQAPDQELLRQMGSAGVPVADRVFGAGHHLRPQLIQFHRCRDVLVSDVALVDPPMWTVHPVLSANVTVRRVTVDSSLHNTDGCDPEACRDVHITDCSFDTNDDCVAVKSGRDEDGRRVGVPSENIVVQDCRFSGRWGGLAVGSEMSGGVRNVFAERCVINSPDFPGRYPVKYPLYVKTGKKRGGYVSGVHLRDITGAGVDREAVFVTLDYNGGEGGTLPVRVEDITVARTRLDGAAAVLRLDGVPTDHLRRVRLDHCAFTGVRGPDTVTYTDDLTFHRVTVNGTEVTRP
ncbi:glycoside hydrolase family 28 protein [Streptomyces sp. 7R007]